MSTLAEGISAQSIRKESALTLSVVVAASIPEFDGIIQDRIDKRASYVGSALQNEAGSYAWPFSDATLAQLYPTQTPQERQETYDEQWGMAQDATRFYVLGDLFMRVSERNPAYLEKAKYYWSQAKEILTSLKLDVKNSSSGGGSSTELGGGGLSLLVIKLPRGHKPQNEFGIEDGVY